MKKRYCVLLLYVLFMGHSVLFTQTVTTKKDIAVFGLSHMGGVPAEIAGRIDQRITAVVTSFKRFNVIGMQYRLRTSDISGFIDKIKETKENQADIPETVLSGEEAFTRADWERVAGAFLVFIPHITAYDETIVYKREIIDGKEVIKKYWEVKIEGTVTIIDVSGVVGQRVLPLSVTESAKRRSIAIDAAIEAIGRSVYTAIKFEPEFALSSGILAVDRKKNTVTMQLGYDMGIKVGDEYTVQKILSVGGLQSSVDTGFFIISEVYDSFSVGRVVYASQPIVEGDSVRERPHINLDVNVYGGITVPMTGVRSKQQRDYLRVQPTFGLRVVYWPLFHLGFLAGYEYAIQQLTGQSTMLAAKPLKSVPFGIGYIGVSVYNFYGPRFKIAPELHFCFSGIGLYPQPQNSSLLDSTANTKKPLTALQLGGRAMLSAAYFLSRTWTINIHTGIGYMHGLMSAEDAAKKFFNEGILSASDVKQLNAYDWDILSSHLNLYLFVGITKRL